MTTTVCLGPFQELVRYNFPQQKMRPAFITGHIEHVSWPFLVPDPWRIRESGVLVFVADDGVIPHEWMYGKLPPRAYGMRNAWVKGHNSHFERMAPVFITELRISQFTTVYPEPLFHESGMILIKYFDIGPSGEPYIWDTSPPDQQVWSSWDYANKEPAIATFRQAYGPSP
jgi:hypothetical protein